MPSWGILALLGNHRCSRKICIHSSVAPNWNRSKKRKNRVQLTSRKLKMLAEVIHGSPVTTPLTDALSVKEFLSFLLLLSLFFLFFVISVLSCHLALPSLFSVSNVNNVNVSRMCIVRVYVRVIVNIEWFSLCYNFYLFFISFYSV